MIESKPWDWSKNESGEWLIPAVEAGYLAESWEAKGFHNFLDLGCGLGRHSIYFAKKGYNVDAVDLSEYAVQHLADWNGKERLNINIQACDMLNLPFPDNSFDCIMAYNVIYHTETQGFLRALGEIRRVLKQNGELFLTLISKNTWSYRKADEYKRIDDNTILRNESDTERNVPHFYVDIEDINRYFAEFFYVRPPVEQIVYDIKNSIYNSTHFNLLVGKK